MNNQPKRTINTSIKQSALMRPKDKRAPLQSSSNYLKPLNRSQDDTGSLIQHTQPGDLPHLKTTVNDPVHQAAALPPQITTIQTEHRPKPDFNQGTQSGLEKPPIDEGSYLIRTNFSISAGLIKKLNQWESDIRNAKYMARRRGYKTRSKETITKSTISRVILDAALNLFDSQELGLIESEAQLKAYFEAQLTRRSIHHDR